MENLLHILAVIGFFMVLAGVRLWSHRDKLGGNSGD